MKFVIVCCLLVMVTATKNQKISLEDIERDNLKTEKSTGTVLTKSPVNYNFVPYKTAIDYVRQQPREQYLQHQQIVKQNLSPPTQIRYLQQQQQQQYQQEQYQTTPQFYYQQPAQQSNYQQYENVQIINDNSIGQQQHQQQYYTPYVYLQQYTSPSTSVQTVVDPKNGLQYIMYIPTYVPKSEQTQNYETVVYPEQQQQPQQYNENTQYVVQSQQQQEVPTVQYVEEAQAKTRYFTTKQEPKSLLDSYVPSILQLQYYKQQQQQQQQPRQQLNSIETSYKTQQTGKSEYVKSRPQAAESTTNLKYYIPSHK